MRKRQRRKDGEVMTARKGRQGQQGKDGEVGTTRKGRKGQRVKNEVVRTARKETTFIQGARTARMASKIFLY